MIERALSDKSMFQEFVRDFEARPGYVRPQAFALGLARFSVNKPDVPLDVFYPHPNHADFGKHWGTYALFADATEYTGGNVTTTLDARMGRSIENGFHPFTGDGGLHPNIDAFYALKQWARTQPQLGSIRAVVTFIGDLSCPPETVADVYLRLHLLSHRLVKPNEANLNGAFGILPNVVWTSVGPMLPEEVPSRRMATWGTDNQFFVRSQDKFPFMVDYVTLPDVRVVAAHCARLGAYLGPGTTIMPSGFVNFNAGTEENCMIEGRVSQGVMVGANSDLGGGASTMGTLSGGGTERVSVGSNCLIGANGGIGISLGDRCTVEAGLYVTAGMKVLDLRNGDRCERKAITLSGQDDLLFRRNSETGVTEVLRNEKPNKPNTILHQNKNV